ncbi:MAG: TetR family transcriptional regulator [Solirubrobacteraceae bacterium]|jgi:AcrR family transcriptional regulator/DNA-binding MarR family transcriptional regulator
MAEEAAIRGASSLTVARVIARARVSRRLFYEQFADIEDCFLASFDWGVGQARATVVEAADAERSWREQIRSGLAALLRFFDQQPLLAQLCVVHAAGGGRRVLERRAQAMAELCEAVDRGRAEASSARPPGRLVAEGVVGAVMAVLYMRLFARDMGAAGGFGELTESEPALLELHGELMNLIVLPYLGAAVAARELGRSVPSPPRNATQTQARPIGRVGLEEPAARLTYRTVRVLRAIAELPAASNREVAERAGIIDQGQISKILTRLEYQGLVANRRGVSAARGTPNSWWLTERGEALEREVGQRPVGEHDAGRREEDGRARGERRRRR